MVNQHKNRVVLENVPKVAHHIDDRYFFTPFAACLRSCLTFLGEDYTYSYILGMSSAAFRQIWHTQRWEGGNIDIVFMDEDPFAPHRRAFEAAGYGLEILSPKTDNEQVIRNAIIQSIRDKGHPVLAMGVIGPPEICIVAGYDEGGNVLIGWNFFQQYAHDFPEAEFEPCGYFRKRDWFKNTPGVLLIGDKQDKPPLSELYHQALKWGIKVTRTPIVHSPLEGDFYSGLRAYEAWADCMLRDDEFPDDIKTLEWRKMVHYDGMCMLAERGDHATAFLREIAEHEPAIAEHLLAAVTSYEEEKQFLYHMHDATGGYIPPNDKEKLRKLVEPNVRQRIAQAIRNAQEKDAAAIAHIERALGE